MQLKRGLALLVVMTSIKNILKSLTRITLALFFCITIIGLIIARPVNTKSHINHQITVN